MRPLRRHILSCRPSCVRKNVSTVIQNLKTCLGTNSCAAFPTPPTPKNPLSPGRERWRSQMHKLNSLSTGIRGLQAKLQLLREESDQALDDSSDISELGPNLMSQY